MGIKTNIAWTDATWNYIRASYNSENIPAGQQPGWFCTKRTAGCVNCYAEELNMRLGNGLTYTKANLDKVEFYVPEKQLIEPLKWKHTQHVFVNSMTDFFHPAIPDWMRRLGFLVMHSRRDCVFQILTKQPERMEQFFKENNFTDCCQQSQAMKAEYPNLHKSWIRDTLFTPKRYEFPLPNVWLGVSLAEQKDTWMLEPLFHTPAAKRFVSIEPLLSPMALPAHFVDAGRYGTLTNGTLDWAIVGGESGSNRRDCGVDAIIDIVSQFQAAGVPCFVKQDCALKPGQQGRIPDDIWALKEIPE